MLEILLTIILLPIAAVSIVFTVAFGVALFASAFKRKKK